MHLTPDCITFSGGRIQPSASVLENPLFPQHHIKISNPPLELRAFPPLNSGVLESLLVSTDQHSSVPIKDTAHPLGLQVGVHAGNLGARSSVGQATVDAEFNVTKQPQNDWDMIPGLAHIFSHHQPLLEHVQKKTRQPWGLLLLNFLSAVAQHNNETSWKQLLLLPRLILYGILLD